jgi:uncharacterized membrane protein SirB2
VPLPLYKLIHIVGIILIMSALGGAAVRAMTIGAEGTPSSRRLLAVLHGIGAFLVLLGGFGMLARLGFMHGANFPGWLWVKLVVWVILAAALIVPRRRPTLARPLLLALPFLGGLAAYMAIYKPF